MIRTADKTVANSVSGTMTAALIGYSGVFMRYSTAISPVNYLLFGCHLVNFSAQSVQGYRYLNYWKYVSRPHTFNCGLLLEGGIYLDEKKLTDYIDSVDGNRVSPQRPRPRDPTSQTRHLTLPTRQRPKLRDLLRRLRLRQRDLPTRSAHRAEKYRIHVLQKHTNRCLEIRGAAGGSNLDHFINIQGYFYYAGVSVMSISWIRSDLSYC